MVSPTIDSYRRVFGDSELVRFDADLSTVRAFPETEAILRSVGLPWETRWGLRFGRGQGAFVQISKAIELSETEAQATANLYVIGNDEHSFICVDSGSGCVFWVVLSSPLRIVHKNRSVREMAMCMAAYEEFLSAVDVADESKLDELIRGLATRLAEADPTALVDPDSYWSQIYEQASDRY